MVKYLNNIYFRRTPNSVFASLELVSRTADMMQMAASSQSTTRTLRENAPERSTPTIHAYNIHNI